VKTLHFSLITSLTRPVVLFRRYTSTRFLHFSKTCAIYVTKAPTTCQQHPRLCFASNARRKRAANPADSPLLLPVRSICFIPQSHTMLVLNAHKQIEFYYCQLTFCARQVYSFSCTGKARKGTSFELGLGEVGRGRGVRGARAVAEVACRRTGVAHPLVRGRTRDDH
jgi:hypothetical protein